jgi:hypothetical protein
LAGLDAMDRRALKVIKLEWVLFGQRANRRRRWRRCGGALAEHVVFLSRVVVKPLSQHRILLQLGI